MADLGALQAEKKQLEHEVKLHEDATPVDKVATSILEALQDGKIQDPFMDPTNEWIGHNGKTCCVIL